VALQERGISNAGAIQEDYYIDPDEIPSELSDFRITSRTMAANLYETDLLHASAHGHVAEFLAIEKQS
jgi:hypothetical protein